MKLLRYQGLAAPLLAMFIVGAVWGPIRACVNSYTYARNLRGEMVDFGGAKDFVRSLQEHEDETKLWKTRRADLAAKLASGKTDFQTRADYASIGIYLKEIPQTLAQLEALEQEKPGEFVIAGNLGTAYELSGQNALALHWIKTEVLRNPRAHEGTEWLHVKILEAKLALETDPDWLKSNSVLGLDFGIDEVPRTFKEGPTDFQGQTISIPETIKALKYQLHERTFFVAPPDPIVAQLLSDLACLEADFASLPDAETVMNYAMTYQPVNKALCAERASFFKENSDNAGVARIYIKRVVFYGFLGVLTLIAFVFGMKWFCRRLSRSAAKAS